MENQKTKKQEILKPKRKDIHFIDHRLIVIEKGFNPREDYGDIDTLYESIKINGIQMPLKGFQRGGKWVLTDGHRRMRCEKMFYEQTGILRRVPILSSSNKTDHRILEAIITGSDGKNLTPIELGKAYKRLNDMGYSYPEISKRVGYSQALVHRYVNLLKFPKKIQKYVQDQVVSASILTEILRNSESIEEAVQVIKKAKKQIDKAGKKKITPKDIEKKHLYLDSFKELRELVRKHEDSGKRLKPTMIELFNFCTMITDNKITKQQLENLFYDI